jgi:hypothetical protein
MTHPSDATIELLPCPHCGGEAPAIFDPTTNPAREYFMLSCKCQHFSTHEGIVKAWNTRAYQSTAEEGQWLPIESAPKDGTMIIGRESDGSVHRVLFDDEDGESQAEGWNFDSDSPSSATHWMPLPTLPNQPSNKE